jgi:hypothetical protein
MTTATRADAGTAASWLDRYRGLGLELVLRLARLEQRPVRVVGPHQAITADLVPSRLTVRVDADGRVLELRAG